MASGSALDVVASRLARTRGATRAVARADGGGTRPTTGAPGCSGGVACGGVPEAGGHGSSEDAGERQDREASAACGPWDEGASRGARLQKAHGIPLAQREDVAAIRLGGAADRMPMRWMSQDFMDRSGKLSVTEPKWDLATASVMDLLFFCGLSWRACVGGVDLGEAVLVLAHGVGA